MTIKHIVTLPKTVNSEPVPQQARTTLAANGRIVIPAAIREALGFKPGEALVMNVHEGALRIESFDARLNRIQDEVIRLAGPGRSLVDELLADRRGEVRREQEAGQAEAQQLAEQARKVG
jgi:AbrB family looped-hinge helix DNA binding protein